MITRSRKKEEERRKEKRLKLYLMSTKIYENGT